MTTHGSIYTFVEQKADDLSYGDSHDMEASYRIKGLLPKIQELEPRWISVEERLPELGVEHLLLTKGGVFPGYRQTEGFSLLEVTHWMPLPLPPKN